MPNTLEAKDGGELRAIAIGDAARQLNELRQRDPPLDHVERVPEVVRAFPGHECRYYAIGVSRRALPEPLARDRTQPGRRWNTTQAGGHPLPYLSPLA